MRRDLAARQIVPVCDLGAQTVEEDQLEACRPPDSLAGARDTIHVAYTEGRRAGRCRTTSGRSCRAAGAPWAEWWSLRPNQRARLQPFTPVNDDPLRMFIVIRRGAVASIARGGELAGAAAVGCVREFADDPALQEWRARPGKVVLRARGGQWQRVLEEPHAIAGDPDGESAVALPPRRRSERGPLLEQMQAMTSALEPPPADDVPRPVPGKVTYVVNPKLEMSSGKTIAQIAHAAVMAADTGDLEDWVAAGCPARVVTPVAARFEELCESENELAAKVVDAGLTEVAPGTVTVLALYPEHGRATGD
jgi:peptidyl-tRNA hydrolase